MSLTKEKASEIARQVKKEYANYQVENSVAVVKAMEMFYGIDKDQRQYDWFLQAIPKHFSTYNTDFLLGSEDRKYYEVTAYMSLPYHFLYGGGRLQLMDDENAGRFECYRMGDRSPQMMAAVCGIYLYITGEKPEHAFNTLDGIIGKLKAKGVDVEGWLCRMKVENHGTMDSISIDCNTDTLDAGLKRINREEMVKLDCCQWDDAERVLHWKIMDRDPITAAGKRYSFYGIVTYNGKGDCIYLYDKKEKSLSKCMSIDSLQYNTIQSIDEGSAISAMVLDYEHERINGKAWEGDYSKLVEAVSPASIDKSKWRVSKKGEHTLCRCE